MDLEIIDMKKYNAKRTKEILNCFESDSLDDIIFWAFRYFIGRQTIATCCFAEDLARAYPLLSDKIKNLIKRELEEEFRRDDKEREAAAKENKKPRWLPLGADCDRESWEYVRRAYTQAPDVASPENKV
mgnify:FL=1